MATKRRVKRNIKEDQLVTVAVRFSQWAQEHFTHIMVGVAALAVIVAGIVFAAHNRRSASAEAQRQLSGALTLYQQGEYEAARTSFRQLHERYGGRPALMARYFEAECNLVAGDFAQALEGFGSYFDEAGDDAVFRVPAMYGKAVSHAGLQEYAEAANTMVELLTLLEEGDPRYLDAAFQAGEFFAKAGDVDQAAKYFDEVVEKGVGLLRERAIVSVALLGR